MTIASASIPFSFSHCVIDILRILFVKLHKESNVILGFLKFRTDKLLNIKNDYDLPKNDDLNKLDLYPSEQGRLNASLWEVEGFL